MIVPLSINVVLCFKEDLLIVAYTFSIVRIWASWYDKPFNMEDIVDKFILLL